MDPEGLVVRGKLLRWRLASLLPEHQLGDHGEVQGLELLVTLSVIIRK